MLLGFLGEQEGFTYSGSFLKIGEWRILEKMNIT